MSTDKLKDTVIIYHGNCIDGFTSAWLVYKALRFIFDDSIKIDLWSAAYSDKLPDVRDKNVYMVDFSVKPEKMEELLNYAESITVIDHHEVAFTALEPLAVKHDNLLLYCRKDKCGAMLVYDFFDGYKLSAEGEMLLTYIDDYDRWIKAKAETDYIMAYITTIKQTLENWDKLFAEFIPGIVEKGKLIYESFDLVIKEHIKKSLHYITIDYIKIPVVNIPSQFTNRACELMYSNDDIIVNGAEVAGAYYVKKDGNVKFSLRSKPETVDVNSIASKLGGGGHTSSAGFVTTLEYLDSLID